MMRALRGAGAALLIAAPILAQDANYLRPITEIETMLREGGFSVLESRGSRAAGDRTQQLTLQFPDGAVLNAKIAKAPPGGSTFNNEPRYELAAYELQKLFLDPADYAVPPTVVRALPLDYIRTWDPGASQTFDNAKSVVAVLQYWLLQVTPEKFYDKDRAKTDSVYARHLGDFNIVTYLIRHNDSNAGNFLISKSPTDPRVFTVDNGVAFESQVSDRGFEWRNMRVDRISKATVERLRAITPEMLDRLAVLVQFENRNGQLEAVPPTANLEDGRGVRRKDSIVQFGLTAREIRGVANRLKDLLENVDKGKIEVF